MEDNKRKLYDALSEDYDLGSFEQFSADIADDTKRRKLYDAAIEDYDFGDFDSFSSQLGFGKGASAQSESFSTPSDVESDTPQFDDEPNLAPLNESARKSAEKEQRKAEKEAEKAASDARKASERAARDANKARRDMTPQERTKAFNARFVEKEKAYAEAHPEEVAAENEALRKRNAEIRAEKERTAKDVQSFGTGTDSYSFEEAVSAGEQFAEIAPEIENFDKRMADFNARYAPLEKQIADYNAGKVQLTPDEFRQMQSEYEQYQKESTGLSELAKRYDEVLNTAPGKEYREVSERMTKLAEGPKTADSAWEYAQEFARLQKNPLYRASLGEDAPSEDEIQSNLLQGQIAYVEEKLKTAKGNEKKELKKAYSDAKEALYANPYYKKHLEAKIAENNAENERIGVERANYVQQLRAGYADQGIDPQYYWQMEKGDPELQKLDAAAHMHDDAIREYRKPTKYDESRGGRNVGKGFGDWASDTDTWSFGIEGFAEDIAIVRPVLEKVQSIVGNVNEDDVVTEGNIKALEEQLTPGELAVLDAYFEKVGAVAAKGADTSIGYQIGQGIGDMVTLGIEMIATGSAGGVARAATEKGLKKGLVKVLGKRAYRKAAQSGAGKVALWAASKVPADMVETAVRLPFMPSTYKALGEGSVQLDSDYKVRPLAEYAPEKLWDQYVEQLTEVSNGFAFPLIGKVVKTPGMQKMVKGVLGENGARALRTFMERGDIKLLDDAMLGSFGGEWEEELLGATIHSITDDPNALRDFFSAEQQLVLLGTLAPLPISRGLRGGVPMAYTAAKAGVAWDRAQQELERAGLDEGRIARLKEVLDNAPVPEAAREVMNAWNDATEGFMEVEDSDFALRGTLGEPGISYRESGRLYDRLAHYFWAAQQKRAAGLMAEVEQDRKIADKRAELEQRYGGVFFHPRDTPNGETIDVVDRATITGADGNPMNVLITSEYTNSNDEYPYVAEDGSKGFVVRQEAAYHGEIPLDEYLARLVMQDAQTEQVQGMVNEAVQGNRSLREVVEALPEVTYNGQKGTIARATEDGAVFVPDDSSAENVPLTWAELAEANGIEVPEVATEAEKNEADAAKVAANYQAQQDIADGFKAAMDASGGLAEAYVDTDEGRAYVIDIISDTIDPEAGTAQFSVQLPDGRRSVTMSIPIEPVIAQLNGEETAPEEEPVEVPAEAPVEEPAPEEPVEEEPKIPLDKDGNPVYDAPGVSVEDALADMYSTEGLDEADVDEYILNRAKEADKGRDVKQGKTSLKEWGQKKKEANRVADFWGELAKFANENKAAREKEEKAEAERKALIEKYGVDTSRFDLTPHTLQEAVAEYLGNSEKIIDLADAIRETLGRRPDGRVPSEIFRHVGNGGLLVKKGGRPVADVANDISHLFYDSDEYEDEARDHIIDFLMNSTKSEMREFIFNQRLDEARREAEMYKEAAPKNEGEGEKAPQTPPAEAPKPENPPQVPPAEAPKPEVGKPEGEAPAGQGEKGEEKPGNTGKNEGNSVPLNEGTKVPASASDITNADEARAFFENKFGKGKRADNSVRVWELTHKKAEQPKSKGGLPVSKMAMSLAGEGGLSEEEASELVTLGTQLAEDYIVEDGLVKFPQFFKNLVETFGDGIRPFSKQIYLGASANVSDEIADQMDDRKTVRAFDTTVDLNDISDEQSTDSLRDDAGRDSAPVPSGDEGGVEGEEGGTDVPPDTGTPGEDSEGSGNGDNSGDDNGGGEEGGPEQTSGDTQEEDGSVAAGSDGGRSGSADGSRRRGGKRGGANGRGRGGKRTGGTERGESGGAEPGLPEGVTEEAAEESKEEPDKTRETAKAEKEKAVSEETSTDKLEGNKDELKEKLSSLDESEENAAERERLSGELEAVIDRLRELYKNAPKKLESLEKEKVPYLSASDPSGEHSIGSVVPSGVADAMNTAMARIEKEVGKPLAEFVREELGYESLEEMLTRDGKDTGLSGEQVDATALAIYQMKQGRMFINGDMTGIGKGRVGAALIRWAVRHGKKCIFATDKPGLFSDMYRDITDIGSGYKSDKDPGLLPFIINDKDPGNKNKTVTILNSEKKEMVTTPSKTVKSEVFSGDGSSLPAVGGSVKRERRGPEGGPQFKGKQYDFVMMTYSQAQSARGAFAKSKLDWLKSYAKDAFIICDESHLAAGDSSRGDYFQDMVKSCGGVTFMSATFAKNPKCMKLYALRSSMGDARMSDQAFIETVENYGVPMQEFLAQSLIESGEMVRRERDFTGVETTWTNPKELYSEEEYNKCRETNDKTVGLIRDIITFQRSFIEPIIKEMNAGIAARNEEAKMNGEGWFYSYTNTAYSSQVSNICNLMFYAMKAKKAADVAIEKMKKGEKAIIVVDNTLEGYIKDIEGIVNSPDFTAVFDKGAKNILKYRFNKRWKKLDREESEEQGKEVWIEDEDKAEITEFDSIRSSFDDATEQAYKNLLLRIKEYSDDKTLTRLSISPIDYIKELIHDAGFSCGEITGREVQLTRLEDGTYTKDKRDNERKDTEYRFNGGTAENPLPANEQYDAIILNSAAATGISLHASRRFGNKAKRNMVIVQPAKDQNVEVQVRGRNDRTGQVQRGSYYYITSPIPAEFKTVMMLRKKLASLDAQASGTANVSSNKVDADDMDNKYGDEVAKDFLSEHPEINAQLDNPIEQTKDKKSGEKIWKGRPGLLYNLLIGMQRMTCAEQEMILNSLQEQYIELVEYYEQNGTNELSSSVLDLDAVTIDEGVFVHGKDNSSISGFAHDTKLERIEANILKKPMLSSQIYDKMRQLGAITSEGKIDFMYGDKIDANVEYYAEQKKKELRDKNAEELENLIETIREATPIGEDQTESDYELAIRKSIPVVEMRERHLREEKANDENLDLQVARVNIATNNLKPGMLVMVPLVDGAPDAVPYGPGRFIGFKASKDWNPKSIKATFATKDSRSSIDIPVVKMKDMITGIVRQTNSSGDLYERNLLDIGGSRYDASLTEEDRRQARDEWWDKRIPKNKGRQIRYIITGNLFQAGFNLGTMKKKDKDGYAQKDENVRGKMCLFTRRDPETGRVTVEQGMLLVDSFDPETFYVSDVVKKEDIWDSGDSIRDDKSNINVFRSGNNLVVQFFKRKSEKIANHPVLKDKTILGFANEDKPNRYKEYIEISVPDEKVEDALEYLYKEYGFTRSHLFVMPDSTEKVDAIVPDDRPYQEIIDEMNKKYPYYSYVFQVENELTKLIARHKADIENEDVVNQIKDFVKYRQALYRKDFAKYDTSRLAWTAIAYQDVFEKETENKQARDKAYNKLDAIKTEIRARLGDSGRLGTLKHFKQGRHTLKEIEDIFKEFNKDKFNKEMADKVFKKFKGIKEANIPIVFSEKVDNGVAGFSSGQLVEYNWKYFNSDWVPDQQKANTVLHELVHTLTVYANYSIEQGYGHLLDDDMKAIVNELSSIYRAIRYSDAFVHDTYTDYGVTDWYEMLSEAASNDTFREDLKKVQLIKTVRDGDANFTRVQSGQDTSGKKVISAYDAVMERLNDLIDSFNETALIEIYRGSGRGEMMYRRGSAENLMNPIDRARAISDVSDLAKKLGVKFKEDSSLDGKGVFDPKTGQIRINIDRHEGTLDLQATLLHEAVAHYGLRKLLGKNFYSELNTIYNEAAPSIRERIDEIAKRDGLSTEVATEEYLASLAEDGRFGAGEESFWQRVWYAIHQLLRELGLKTHLTDADMRALLYASKRNLETRGAVAQAHHISVQNALRKQAELSRENANFVNDDRIRGIQTGNGESAQGDLGAVQGDFDRSGSESMGDQTAEAERETSSRNMDLLQRGLAAEREKYLAESERDGGNGADDADSGTERNPGRKSPSEAASEALVRLARENGLYVDPSELGSRFGKDFPKQGFESVTLVSEDGKTFTKLKDPFRVYTKFEGSHTPFDVINEVAAHNEIFRNTPYRLVGVTETVDGKARLVLQQDAVESNVGARRRQMWSLSAGLGFDFNVFSESWSDENVSIFDVDGKNSLVSKDGRIMVIDPMVHFLVDSDTAVANLREKLNGIGEVDILARSEEHPLMADITNAYERYEYEKDDDNWIDKTEEFYNLLSEIRPKLNDADLGTIEDDMADEIDRIFKSYPNVQKAFEYKDFFEYDAGGLYAVASGYVDHPERRETTPPDGSGTNNDNEGFNDLPEEVRQLAIEQDTDELYRRASQGATAQTAAEMYGDRVRTIRSAVHEVLVDEMAPVDTFMDALATESGMKIKDDERVSDMIRETGGKAMQAVRDYDKKFLQPMWSAVGEFRKNTGSSIKDTETYIGLKSGLERNIVLAQRDAKRDYQAEYDAEIDEINQEEKTKRKGLDKQLDGGKISDVTYAGELTLLQQEIQRKRDDAELRRKGHFADVDAGTDERFLEYRKKDYSAITAWAETEDLQEAERLAGDYVNDMESRAGKDATKEVWKRINAAAKETLKLQYDHQILSRQQYQDISKMMEYYVPMRGFSDDTAEDLFNYYVTPQSNDFQATVLTAKGRKTWYEGPLGNIGAMHSSAISQGVKNDAKLALLDAVRRRPNNSIATVTRAWFVKNGQKDENGKDLYEVAYPQIPQGATLAQREAIIEQFEEDMAEAKKNGDAYNAHREVDLHGGVVAFERQAHKNEHIVQVREGGKEYGILINGNPAAAQAINGVRRSNGAGEKFLGYMRSFTRVLSSMFTTFSVPFWVSNFQRDHGQGLTNAFIRNNPGYVGRYIANRIRAAKLFPLILGKETMDKAIAKGDPVAKLYKQYLDNGGPMGQNRIQDNEYFERQMKRYLDNSAKQGVIKGATAVLDVIGGVGEAIETITRFAVFMTSMESGRPIHESISDAKEISTNFARKGSGRSFSRDELDRMTHADGTKLNPIERGFVSALSVGVEICRATIPFFNAAVQGLENKVTNYRTHWGKTLLADSIYLMLGFGMKMLLGNAGGDDDKEKYSHTSDYLRRNNILNPMFGDGVYAKWALPQEYRVMYALGDILASALQQERPAEDLGMDVFGAIMQLSPIGAVTDEVAFSAENKKKAYETLLTNAAPGIVAPVLESIFNMDFKGARIYNEGFNENLHAYPGWTKALPTTGSEYVAVAKWLNEATGGNDVERGWVNINPAIVEHLVESYFSGPYQIVVRLPEAVAKIAKGEATVRDVPLLNRIILNTNDNQRDAYYSNMYYYFKEKNTEAERIHSEYKGRPKEGKVSEFYTSDNYKYMLVFNKYDKIERELRKASKTMAEKGDKERQKEYDERLQNVQYQIAKECLDIYFGRNEQREVK